MYSWYSKYQNRNQNIKTLFITSWSCWKSLCSTQTLVKLFFSETISNYICRDITHFIYRETEAEAAESSKWQHEWLTGLNAKSITALHITNSSMNTSYAFCLQVSTRGSTNFSHFPLALHPCLDSSQVEKWLHSPLKDFKIVYYIFTAIMVWIT